MCIRDSVKTGAVIAQIGGRNQPSNVTFGFNQAVQTDRDWGSTMKPIVDYGPAFENNIYTSTNNYVSDSPTTVSYTHLDVYKRQVQNRVNVNQLVEIQWNIHLALIHVLVRCGLRLVP